MMMFDPPVNMRGHSNALVQDGCCYSCVEIPPAASTTAILAWFSHRIIRPEKVVSRNHHLAFGREFSTGKTGSSHSRIWRWECLASVGTPRLAASLERRKSVRTDFLIALDDHQVFLSGPVASNSPVIVKKPYIFYELCLLRVLLDRRHSQRMRLPGITENYYHFSPSYRRQPKLAQPYRLASMYGQRVRIPAA